MEDRPDGNSGLRRARYRSRNVFAMSDSPIDYTVKDSVALLRFDDGKANAISHGALNALNLALDHAEKDAGAVLLLGRPGRFSAGFDLATMSEGPDAARALVSSGAELLARMVEAPLPIVAGCTGHALAMGALMLLAADQRLGASGEYKIGLNEVAIRMTLPVFGVELARERLSKRHLGRAVSQAEIYDPAGAVDAGYLDRVVTADALETECLGVAARLAELPRRSFSETKRSLRGGVAQRIRDSLAKDMASWGGAS